MGVLGCVSAGVPVEGVFGSSPAARAAALLFSSSSAIQGIDHWPLTCSNSCTCRQSAGVGGSVSQTSRTPPSPTILYLFPDERHHTDTCEHVLPRQALARNAICKRFGAIGPRLTEVAHKQRHIGPGDTQAGRELANVLKPVFFNCWEGFSQMRRQRINPKMWKLRKSTQVTFLKDHAALFFALLLKCSSGVQ